MLVIQLLFERLLVHANVILSHVFVSYEGLSLVFRAFTIELVSTEIPNNVHEALKNPK